MESNSSLLYKMLGANIKTLRSERKIGQDLLADRINLSRSSISNIESGKHQPSIHTLYAICGALNCTLVDLLPPLEDIIKEQAVDLKIQTMIDDFKKKVHGVSEKNIELLKKKLIENAYNREKYSK